jgi:galactose mutarotase-like enzyme
VLRHKDWELSVRPIEGLSHIHIYIPPDRAAVAIEPQTAGPDCFREHQNGVIFLPPGGSHRLQFRLISSFRDAGDA